MITTTAIVEEIKKGNVSLPPITIKLAESGEAVTNSRRIDARIVGCWDNQKVVFETEVKALSTPKIFMQAIAILKETTRSSELPPLLICPFLSEEQLQKLEKEKINGVDLCGNGIINIKGMITVYRTGKTNRFTSWSPIKNIYRKNSSLVGRMFLSTPRFVSVTQLTEEVRKKNYYAQIVNGLSLTFGTVSKVLSAMEQDLIISKDRSGIALLQPDKLIEKLAGNYTAPAVTISVSAKINLDEQALIQRLSVFSKDLKIPVIATGFSSVMRYAVMEREKKLSLYCPEAKKIMESLSADTTNRFPNVAVFETNDPTVYFDAQEENGFNWASPVQTYLELMSGDKRDQETAGHVFQYIIEKIRTLKE